MTDIHLTADAGRARLTTRAGALVPRVIEIGPDSARVALVAGGALLLGGDSVRVSITVGVGCTLELEDIGGTVAYNADGRGSEWFVDATVEENALLLWHGLPFVVADGANVDRRTVIDLRGHGALACLRETIVLGRTGERGGTIGLRTTVQAMTHTEASAQAHTEAIFVEHLTVSGTDPVPGVLGDNRVLDSVLLLGTRAPADAAGRVARDSPCTEVFELEGEGSITRSLHHEAHRSLLSPVWESWRAHARSIHVAPVAPARSANTLSAGTASTSSLSSSQIGTHL
ncbi:urease accessory protein UreD [Salinibacterium hongtaonis]|uniref:Urease accessory protein n=1 Tax=Homoserinimonas hongtaonis TaxID=2079791 RepID=A0A2U1SXV7_9MICO|nr:urease accessory protein UreD [Salinibacterium hongtaonis]PWB96471.1 urease accessory protein [Salinibacterium hongtaonis]